MHLFDVETVKQSFCLTAMLFKGIHAPLGLVRLHLTHKIVKNDFETQLFKPVKHTVPAVCSRHYAVEKRNRNVGVLVASYLVKKLYAVDFKLHKKLLKPAFCTPDLFHKPLW